MAEGGTLNPTELMRAGWIYHDVRWCLPEVWDQLIALLGEGNYHILATSIRRGPKTEIQRGQLLVSPEGLRRVQERAKQGKETGL